MNGLLITGGVAAAAGIGIGAWARAEHEPTEWDPYTQRETTSSGDGVRTAALVGAGGATLWAGFRTLTNLGEAFATFDGGMGSGPGGSAAMTSGARIAYVGMAGVGLLAGVGVGSLVGLGIDKATGH